MDFAQLEYIITIARKKSLVAASEVLYISQSALSQFVQKLERSLGIALFQRTSKGWFLTPAGEIYVKAAQEILAIRDQAFTEIDKISNGINGHFSIGLGSGRGIEMFSSIFPQFKKDFPGISVDVVEGKSSILKKAVLDGEIDFFIGSNEIDSARLSSQILCSEIFVLAVPVQHPLNQEIASLDTHRVSLSLCENYPMILVDKSVGQRAVIDSMFASCNIKPKVSFESGSSSTIFSMVHSGLGVSIIPLYYAKPFPNVVYYRTSPEQSRKHFIYYLKGKDLSRAELHFISMIKNYYHQTCNISLLEGAV